MSKLLAGIVIGGLGLYAYQRATQPDPVANATPVSAYADNPGPASQPAVEAASSPFHCDGRTRCSEMTSCAEAMYFLKNCPDVKMDGEGDGVPCEKQWCGQH
jgi:hypothetical protein